MAPGAISRPREHRAALAAPAATSPHSRAQPRAHRTGPSPCSPGVPCASPGCRQSTQDTSLAGAIPARQQDPPFTESGDFSQGGPALALLELAAAMASPPAGSREETTQHHSHGTQGAQTQPRAAKSAQHGRDVGTGLGKPGTHRLPPLINPAPKATLCPWESNPSMAVPRAELGRHPSGHLNP